MVLQWPLMVVAQMVVADLPPHPLVAAAIVVVVGKTNKNTNKLKE